MRTAVYIDYENVLRAVQNLRAQLPQPGGYTIEQIRKLLRTLTGEVEKVVLRRAYADWEDVGMVGAQGALQTIGVTPIYVQAKRGKSSADIELSLDAQDSLRAGLCDQFVIVGGDRDYMPLARRILEAGLSLIVVAGQDTLSTDLLNLVGEENCWDFFDVTERVKAKTAVRVAGVAPAEIPLPGSPLLDPTSPESQAECLKLVQRATQEYGKEVYLGPFYRNFMNVRFHYWTDEQRKLAVYTLEKSEACKVETRPQAIGTGTYSVIVTNKGGGANATLSS